MLLGWEIDLTDKNHALKSFASLTFLVRDDQNFCCGCHYTPTINYIAATSLQIAS